MKTVTIIYGGIGAGKTLKAKQMIEGRQAVWVDPYQINLDFGLSEVTRSTEVIVVDNAKSLRRFYGLIESDNLVIHRQNKEPIEIKCPDVIIVVDRD